MSLPVTSRLRGKFPRPPIGTVLLQHAEEGALLWLIRSRAVGAPHYKAKDLAKLDARIEGHLDGLNIAGDAGWAVCLEQMGPDRPGDVFVAAALALMADPLRFRPVLEAALQNEDGPLFAPVISALSWSGIAATQPQVAGMIRSQTEGERLIGLASLSCLRSIPPGVLEASMADPSPLVRARALRAIGEMGRVDLCHAIPRGLADPSSECRFWAAWSACLLGQGFDPAAMVGAAATISLERIEQAVDVGARRLPVDQALRWHTEMVADRQLRPALIAARAIGSSKLVPWLFEMMLIPLHARLAGEAFSTLTGLNLALDGFEGVAPEGFAVGPNDDPEDSNVEVDPDEDLPWPAVDKLQSWWKSNGTRFPEKQRFLAGLPVSRPLTPALQAILAEGSQRHRAAAALENAMTRPETPLVEVRSRASRL